MRERKREGRENDTSQSETMRMREHNISESKTKRLEKKEIKREGEKYTSALPPSEA